MDWVLIFYLITLGHGGGPATATFGSQEACEFALTEVLKKNSRLEEADGLCVPQK